MVEGYSGITVVPVLDDVRAVGVGELESGMRGVRRILRRYLGIVDEDEVRSA